MSRFQHSDLSFDVPPEWEDRTITAFAAPLRSGQNFAPNLVITRDQAIGDELVTSYSDRQLVELAKRLEGFDLQRRQETTLGGLPAVELLFTWNSAQGVLKQRQFFVLLRGGKALSLTATVKRSDYAEVESTLDELFASISFQEAWS